MSAAAHIGRIGALAGALGVGAALLTGPAPAWAEPANPDPAGASNADPAGAADASPGTGTGVRGRAGRAAQVAPAAATPAPSASRTDPLPDAVAAPAAGSADTVLPGLAPRRATARTAPAHKPHGVPTADSPAGTAVAPNESAPQGPSGDAVAVTGPAPALSPDVLRVTPAPAAAVDTLMPVAAVPAASTPAIVVAPRLSSVGTVTPAPRIATVLASVADRISTAITSVVNRLAHSIFGSSPFAPQVESPVNWLLLAAARRQPLAAATGAAQVGTPVTPTLLVLDGFNVVPSSVELVEAFTGRWTYFPGMPNMVQGRQDFNLVDPATQEAVGSFSALVSSGDPTSLGSRYVELLVTANDGVNVGTGAGQTPPVGSIISQFSLGLIGVSYSAMPSPGGDKVSAKLTTPFFNIPLPFITYNAAEGVADRTFDNRPVTLGGGYSIAPADPAAETITGSIGLLPLFNSIQGRQVFNVLDAAGKSVGSFTGEFTTTSDTIGISTQAILVTANDGINVGTKVGQTPPVGTVYNVAYFGGEKVQMLYTSIPQPSGDIITITLRTPLGDVDLPPALFNSLNASTEPPIKSLSTPNGQKYVATSALLPAGVNGLPPRDVQIQGYQQYDVFDLLGKKIGSVDADVASQWDGYGVHSKSLLITKVTSGNTGTGPFTVPPVGTTLNFVFFDGGFGFADAVIPQPNGVSVNAFKLITPFGDIPLLPLPLPTTLPTKVDYFNPFLV